MKEENEWIHVDDDIPPRPKVVGGSDTYLTFDGKSVMTSKWYYRGSWSNKTTHWKKMPKKPLAKHLRSRICEQCGIEKPMREYYLYNLHYRRKVCKVCFRAVFRERYQKNKIKMRASQKKNSLKYPEKVKAKTTMNTAVSNGTLKKPTICPKCKKEKRIEGHHEDYSKPLEVIWRCHSCHMKIHSLRNRQRELIHLGIGRGS